MRCLGMWEHGNQMNSPLPHAFQDLRIDATEEIEPQIALLVSDELLAEVAEVSLLSPTNDVIAKLRAALNEAVGHMLDGVSDVSNAQSQKDENRALERVGREASHLYDALSDLMEYGKTESKLRSEIMSCRTLARAPSDIDLTDLLTEPNNPFFYLRDLVADLQECAERAINKAPKADPEWDDFLDQVYREEGGESYTEKRASDYAERSKAHRTPKDLPLQNFLRRFGQSWEEMTGQPFTEGMYHAEVGETVSRGVDAAMLLLRPFLPRATRPMIVTALRKVRRR